MADIKTPALSQENSLQGEESAENQAEKEALIQAIELLFFAYRDFVSDPDAILEADGLGRAHHRVVHFVGRHPGITVAELLGILRITKQSLARVLRQLIERGLVEQKTGTRDRRQRHLYLTEEGVGLERRLAVPQHARVARALQEAGPEAAAVWRQVLLNLVNEEERATVEALITNGEVP
ncbi:MAG: MarR family transcriptional regulator [Parvibaculaceae bacterium]